MSCRARAIWRKGRRLAQASARLVTLSPCHLVTLSLLWVVGCDWPGKPDPNDRPVPEEQVVDFATLFKNNCAGCHGAAGKLGPAPPLNDPLFLAVIPDAELLRVIGEGRMGTPMPAFARRRAVPSRKNRFRSWRTASSNRGRPAGRKTICRPISPTRTPVIRNGRGRVFPRLRLLPRRRGHGRQG